MNSPENMGPSISWIWPDGGGDKHFADLSRLSPSCWTGTRGAISLQPEVNCWGRNILRDINTENVVYIAFYGESSCSNFGRRNSPTNRKEVSNPHQVGHQYIQQSDNRKISSQVTPDGPSCWSLFTGTAPLRLHTVTYRGSLNPRLGLEHAPPLTVAQDWAGIVLLEPFQFALKIWTFGWEE